MEAATLTAERVSGAAAVEVEVELLLPVFRPGKLAVEVAAVEHEAVPTPPIPMLVVAPKDAGTYPVAMLLHGFFLQNHFYQRLLRHVASHGFIMVAPQFHNSILPIGSDTEDIDATGKALDWLPQGLTGVLPRGVTADLSKLALAGHSRGGHTVFSFALGHGKATLKPRALVGLDPVAGGGRSSQLAPKILTHEPCSLDVGGVPVLVVGTGLGEERKNILFPPCAPSGVNHREFYDECRPPCYYLVTKEYGHLDMLDDDAPKFITCVCKGGNACKERMRSCVAGVMVAFLNAVLHQDEGDFKAILDKKRPAGLVPTTLDPVEHRLP